MRTSKKVRTASIFIQTSTNILSSSSTPGAQEIMMKNSGAHLKGALNLQTVTMTVWYKERHAKNMWGHFRREGDREILRLAGVHHGRIKSHFVVHSCSSLFNLLSQTTIDSVVYTTSIYFSQFWRLRSPRSRC